MKPSAPPAPAPTAAGRFTAKFGWAETPVAEATPVSEPPVTRTVLGKVSPVVLPEAGAAWPKPPHCTPIDREKLVFASTMRLSIKTCGVMVSSFSTRARALPMLLPMSRTIRMLVRGSTATVPRSLSTSFTRGAISVAAA